LVFEYRSSEASGPAADREEFREGLFLWHDAIWNKINLRNDRQSYQDGLFRAELPTFDEVSVREALLNAVAHRDYRLGGSVFVRQYVQRLETVSPGGLPPGITPENILDQQNPRNRRLAEALAKCGLIERSGQGMNLMFESAVRQGKALPSLAGTSAHEVRLTLHGTVASPEFVRFIERLGEEKIKSFATYDFLALDHLRHEQSLPDHLKACLPGLVAASAVELIGRGRGTRYILARGLYAALGSKGIYTRKKGLDRGTNKALLLKHIRDNASTGAQMEEFRQVLPALARSQIQVLLRELRAEQAVHSVGVTKGARWFPGPAPANCNPGESSP
jgi:ATP-dependent DNA helicase RecG